QASDRGQRHRLQPRHASGSGNLRAGGHEGASKGQRRGPSTADLAGAWDTSGSGVAIDRQLRLLVANEHVPTRAGVRAALENEGFSVVAEAAEASTAVELALEQQPDICLLAVDLPGN